MQLVTPLESLQPSIATLKVADSCSKFRILVRLNPLRLRMTDLCEKFKLSLWLCLLRIFFLMFLLVLIPVLLGVAFFTLLERKLLRLVGFRVGPNKVLLGGFLQPIADAFKLSSKQVNILSNFSFFFYYARSLLLIRGSFFLWYCYFRDPSVYSFKFLVLFFIAVLSLNSLRSIFRGWRTFRKFSLIGSLRTVCQLISYEAPLCFCLFFLFTCSFSFCRADFLFYGSHFIAGLFPYCLYIWLPCMLAELNRTPYDFSEGERELVRGFNTEFGSSCFTLIFLAEYSNMIFFCSFRCLLFFEARSLTLFLLIFFFLIWVRSVIPRYRFDKLISLSWKFFIPFLTLWFILFCLFF